MCSKVAYLSVSQQHMLLLQAGVCAIHQAAKPVPQDEMYQTLCNG